MNYYVGHGKNRQSTRSQWAKVEEFKDMKITYVSVGYYFALYLTNEGKVYSAGYNDYGNLGLQHKKTDTYRKPTLIEFFVDNGLKIIRLATGTHHALALTESGQVYSWGYNSNGQVGNGTTSSCDTPYSVSDEHFKNKICINIQCGTNMSGYVVRVYYIIYLYINIYLF